MTLEEITNEFDQLNLPKFRAKQVYSWVQEKCVESFDEMTNLSKDMREKLAESYSFYNCKINTKLVSKVDDTVKYLFEFFCFIGCRRRRYTTCNASNSQPLCRGPQPK